MWWKYLLEGVFVLVIIGLAGSFWSLLKAPGHLHKLLRDKRKIREMIDLCKSGNYVTDMAAVEFSSGMCAAVTSSWDTAHLNSCPPK